MDEIQLRNILFKKEITRANFVDVFASNEIPKKITKFGTHTFIANTAPRGHTGEHWVGFWQENSFEGIVKEYFDPFGLPAYLTTFRSFLYPRYTFSEKFLQNAFSKMCGLYVALFIYKKSCGYSYADFLDEFFDDPFENDCKVIDFFEKEYNVLLPRETLLLRGIECTLY
jgi:hypothetical protein